MKRTIRSVVFLAAMLFMVGTLQEDVRAHDDWSIAYFVWLHPQCSVTGSGMILEGGGHVLFGHLFECEDLEEDYCTSDEWLRLDAGWMCDEQCQAHGAQYADLDWSYSSCEGECDCVY